MAKLILKISFLFVLLILLSIQGSTSLEKKNQIQPNQRQLKNEELSRNLNLNPNFGKIPLYFIPNEGQVDERALFYAKASRYTLWITKEGFIFDIVGQLNNTNNGHKFIDIKQSTKSKNINTGRDISKLLFLNACKNPLVVPVDTTEHKVSYFIGNNESLWNTDIPSSKAVLYKDLYENIDLKIYGVEKQIEYDFIVRPGGDVSDIEFEYRDVNRTRIDGSGNLVIETSFGELRYMKPLSFQLIEGNRIEVKSRFKKVKHDTYSFEVDKYNLEYELIIDPLIIVYSTYLGGSGRDYGNGIAVDKKGAAYVTGKTYSLDFPIENPIDGSLSGPDDAFVTKINPGGTALIYSTYLGGNSNDEGNDIAIHKNGAVYVTGETMSRDFPTEKPIHKNNSGFTDAFVTKINRKGTALVYSTYLGGWISDSGNGIAVQKNGAAYVTGITFSSDFPYKNNKRENIP